LKTIKTLDPFIIGFSIIFLNHINRFIELIEYLRKNGINCHFTAGGHYASLKYEELFQLSPQLDSIIRFEGEYPMLELARSISAGNDWRSIESLAFKENHKIKANSVHPVEKDLDKFPYPSRSGFKEYCFRKKFTVILAGRGCVHNCSFCNTREFYRQACGPLKRVRNPEMVVAEMNYLFRNNKCSVFLFHDDDFPVKSSTHPDWIVRFCSELERTGLSNKVIWKINCRADDVEEESFSMMKKHGLFLAFLGLEDGTDKGLQKLNKQSTVAKNMRGINILRKLDIGFDYGFMLFQPYTTFRTLNANLEFLRQVCGDGYTPVTFLKLMPLYNTLIENELATTGRLSIRDGIGDYDFEEAPMNLYYDFITDCFMEWLRYPEGVENISRWARNYLLVYKHYYSRHSKGIELQEEIKKIISDSNLFLLDTMKNISDIFASGMFKKEYLEKCEEEIKIKHDHYKKEIIDTMARLLSFIEDNK
jgi:radical SAM superfamily enzyme YgiQ (UPF0313 family)